MSDDNKPDDEIEKQLAKAGIKDPSLVKSFRRIHETIKKRENEEPYQLEMWPAKDVGAPNELTRSSLFAAIDPRRPRELDEDKQGKIKSKKLRPYFRDRLMAVQGAYSIHYTGTQLDQSHLDVFQGIMHIARGLHEGNKVRFTAHQLLKLIGRDTGGTQHEWLYLTFQDLTATSVAIVKDGERVFWGSLLPRGAGEVQEGKYVVELSRDLAKLFARGFTRVEWEQRRKLIRKPLAQWLQLYYASHAKPVPVTVAWIHETSGSTTKSLRRFRQSLKAALKHIQTVGVINSWRIDANDLVHVTRTPSFSQQKHLAERGKKDTA